MEHQGVASQASPRETPRDVFLLLLDRYAEGRNREIATMWGKALREQARQEHLALLAGWRARFDAALAHAAATGALGTDQQE